MKWAKVEVDKCQEKLVSMEEAARTAEDAVKLWEERRCGEELIRLWMLGLEKLSKP